MTIVFQWILLLVAHFVGAIVLPVVLVRYLPKPRGWWSRAGVATVICWVALVVLATLQHYIIGNVDVGYGSKDDPHGFSSQRNILEMMLMGWSLPAGTLLAVALVRWLGQLRHDARS